MQPQIREWWLRTQHPEHPELFGSWLGFGAWIDNEILVISNEVQVSKDIK